MYDAHLRLAEKRVVDFLLVLIGLFSASLTFDIPRTRTRMGDGALSVAGPRTWNALPADIRCALSLDTFKKRLKSYLFSAAYDV